MKDMTNLEILDAMDRATKKVVARFAAKQAAEQVHVETETLPQPQPASEPSHAAA
jgi:hypothetical protein